MAENSFWSASAKQSAPWGKSLFQSLADDELMHIERLKETFDKLTISEELTEGPLPLAAEKQWKNIFEQAQGTVDTMVKGSTGDLDAIALGN